MRHSKSLSLVSCLMLLACAGLAPAIAKDDDGAKKTAEKVAAPASVDQVIETARKENKLMFIQLGRENCGNCQALKKAIQSGKYPMSKKQMGWVELNCDDAKVNADFQKRFKVEGSTLPFVAITDGEGNALAVSSGYLDKAQFDELVAKAKSAAKKLRKS